MADLLFQILLYTILLISLFIGLMTGSASFGTRNGRFGFYFFLLMIISQILALVLWFLGDAAVDFLSAQFHRPKGAVAHYNSMAILTVETAAFLILAIGILRNRRSSAKSSNRKGT
jgi:heme/copper-type cytochrome/quinol oxidase subunit 2